MTKNPLLMKSKEYKKVIAKLTSISVLFALIGVLLLLYFLKVLNIQDSFIKLACTVLGILIPVFATTVKDLQNTAPWETYLTQLIKQEHIPMNEYIRISYAAFLIIEIDDKYLLIKNPHGTRLYQPPARTYPIKTEKELLELEKSFNIKNDNFIRKKYNDYRFKVPLKQIKKFYKRFCESVNPYTYSYQDIVNDVVEKCGLDKEIFSNATTVFKGRIVKKIEYKRYTDSYEMNTQDVCKLFLTEEQKDELRKIMDVQNDGFKFVTEDIIAKNGIDIANGNLYADIMVDTYDLINKNFDE